MPWSHLTSTILVLNIRFLSSHRTMCKPTHSWWPESHTYLAGGGLVGGLQFLRKLAGAVTGCRDTEPTVKKITQARTSELGQGDSLRTRRTVQTRGVSTPRETRASWSLPILPHPHRRDDNQACWPWRESESSLHRSQTSSLQLPTGSQPHLSSWVGPYSVLLHRSLVLQLLSAH